MSGDDVLALHVGQIIDGDAKCCECERDAEWMVSTGADPDPEPCCHSHAADFIDFMPDFMRGRAAKQYGAGEPAATS